MGKKDSIPTLDLHGKRKDEVFDLVDAFIMKYHSKEKARIMPGKGTGVVRDELIAYLKQGGYPWSYENTESGRNTGSIIVFL